MKETYGASQLSIMFKLPIRTVYSRLYSKYARDRWGVNLYILPDGKNYRVPKQNLHLWKENPSYIGRPRKGDKNE